MKLLHLQGLRALAIISVSLFHFFPANCPNGYLGVDQFFLLSGYLMTMMLSRQKQLGLSEISDFLYRRLRRITPLYYLVTLGILVSLQWTPQVIQSTNENSAPKALFFLTNLFRPTENDGYFEKLGLAVDMFTHTWSLAVEVQFYLIFPLFFVHFLWISKDFKGYFMAVTASASLLFYFTSDEFTAFNNIFARIWQFLTGMAMFNLSQSTVEENDPDNEFLLEPKKPSQPPNNSNFFFIGALILTILLLFWGETLDQNFARLNITILTAVIMHFGHGFWLLENKISVLIGEISYGWYLAHWPIVAHLRVNHVEAYSELFIGFCASLCLAWLLYFIYERHFLSAEKKVILPLVLTLLAANGVALLFGSADSYSPSLLTVHPTANSTISNITTQSDGYFYPSDTYVYPLMGYENMTNPQKIALHNSFDSGDTKQVTQYLKEVNPDPQFPKQLYYFKEGSNSTNQTIMVIGNSVAENTIGLIRDECRGKYANLSIGAVAGCEPLVHSLLRAYQGYNCAIDTFFVNTVKKVRPDVLFLIYRHIDTMLIEKGENPFSDANFKTAVERIREMEKVVGKRIYLVDPWPETSAKITRTLNDYLQKGTAINDASLIDTSQRTLVGKQRMVRLAASCKKCRIFDFSTMFYFNGVYKIYDPKHFVSFFTAGMHFSPPGLERIRPLVRDLCNNI